MTTPTVPDLPDNCWPIDPACLGDTWEAFDAEVQARAAALATSTLYRLTLGRVGGCPITVRPCLQDFPGRSWRGSYYSSVPFTPMLLNGTWVNCGCGNGCGCMTGCRIELGTYVGRVDEIKVDGAVIDPTSYRILSNEVIVWSGDGECPFPKRQNLAAADTEVGTFSVTYLPSRPVDGLGAYAAGLLAVEFAKACTGNTGCKLPKGTTAIVRQGISITIATGAFPNGLTGIREVDAYIALYNPSPGKIISAPQVWSPDMDDSWREQ